jgi:hypothetical protein
MNHFVQRLGEMKAGTRICIAGLRVNMSVTARPIRAPQAGIGEADPSPEHDNGRGEQRPRQRQAPEPPQSSLRMHAR